MTDDMERLEARVDATEDLLLGILEILRDRDPQMRPVIISKLEEIEESFRMGQKPMQAEVAKSILGSFASD